LEVVGEDEDLEGFGGQVACESFADRPHRARDATHRSLQDRSVDVSSGARCRIDPEAP